MAVVCSKRSQTWLGAGLILLAFLMLIGLINPFHEFAVEDDWDYARSVWYLCRLGLFQRSELMEASALFPVSWGALFATIFGFSFVTLRLSTLALAGVALIFFYALLGELNFDVSRRILATLVLLASPVFVFLAFSFMTDISFLGAVIGALYCLVRAQKQQQLFWTFAGSIFVGLAFLSRQLGGLIAFAYVTFILFQQHGRVFRQDILYRLLAATVVPGLVVGGYGVWLQFFGGATWADHTRSIAATWHFWAQPDFLAVLLRRLVESAATLGVYLLPLWLAGGAALLKGWPSWKQYALWHKVAIGAIAVTFTAIVVRLAARDEWFPYLPDQLTRRGLRPYLSYTAYYHQIQRPLVVPLGLSVVLTVLGVVTGIILCVWLFQRISRPLTPELGLIYWSTFVLLAGSLAFFSFYERYLLPLMPGMIILVLDRARHRRFSSRVAWAGILAAALCSGGLMQDYFALSQAKWAAAEKLAGEGVPPERIDAGFEWNGWHLYDKSIAHIQAHHLPMQITPWEYILDPQYIVAFGPVPGYHIETTLVFATPLRFAGHDAIFLLRRG